MLCLVAALFTTTRAVRILDSVDAFLGGELLFTAHADNIDLGTACGEYFRTSVLSIVDAGAALLALVVTRSRFFLGDSDILKNMPSEY